MDANEIMKRVTDYGEALDCDICGEFICASYQMDLNGSWFVCGKCIDTPRERHYESLSKM